MTIRAYTFEGLLLREWAARPGSAHWAARKASILGFARVQDGEGGLTWYRAGRLVHRARRATP